MILELFLLILVLIVWLVHRKREAQNKWRQLGITPVDIGNPLIRFFVKKKTFLETDIEIYQRTKPHKYAGFAEFFGPVIYLTDPDTIKNILVKDFDHFVNRRGLKLEKSDPHWRLTLFNQDNEPWKNIRSKMTPTFTTGKIKRMYTFFDTSAQELVKAIKVKSKINPEFDMTPLLQKCTMDIIAKTAFGLETNLFDETSQSGAQFSKMGQRIQDQFVGKNIPRLMFMFTFPKIADFFGLKVFDEIADEFMSRIIKQCLKHRIETNEKREDFLQLMLEARLNQKSTDDVKVDFSDDLIIAQSMGFILGGFDTTSSALDWAVFELAVNQEIQEKLRRFIQKVVESNGGVFDYDVINSLEYLDMFMSETMRKYPVASRLDRCCNKDYRIPNSDVTIPKGTVVTIPMFGLHHDPELWPEPNKFDPERFNSENVANRHPCAQLPFGQGPRLCIANRFVMTELKAIVAQLVHNFKLEPAAKTDNPPIFANIFGLKPKNGMHLKMTPRN